MVVMSSRLLLSVLGLRRLLQLLLHLGVVVLVRLQLGRRAIVRLTAASEQHLLWSVH